MQAENWTAWARAGLGPTERPPVLLAAVAGCMEVLMSRVQQGASGLVTHYSLAAAVTGTGLLPL